MLKRIQFYFSIVVKDNYILFRNFHFLSFEMGSFFISLLSYIGLCSSPALFSDFKYLDIYFYIFEYILKTYFKILGFYL